MVHLSKLAVGIRDSAHLASVQSRRREQEGVLRHTTRLAPKRADELLQGGSIYWIITGSMLLRQRVIGIEAALREDGVPCAELCLDPLLVAVAPRAVRPFQGWRYLEVADAPPDLADTSDVRGLDALPESMRQALQSLALL